MEKQPLLLAWLIKIAWRDSRQSRSRLILFTASIVLGIAALVAINSFRFNLENDIQAEAKGLLGADLVVRHNQPLSDSANALLEGLGGEMTREKGFASMLIHPKTEGFRLVQVRALDGRFPFYGTLETTPAKVSLQETLGASTLVESTVLLQMGAAVGDTVMLGLQPFTVGAALDKMPGQTGVSMSMAPPVIISMEYLEKTDLLQRGSRVFYSEYFRFDEEADLKGIVEQIKGPLELEGARVESYDDRQQQVGRAFDNLNRFLNLIGFIALLLGCVGVASSIHLYVKEKLNTVAVFRCLGMSGQQAFVIYLLQTAAIGLIGSVAGAILGSGIQSLLPLVLKDFLPLEVNFGLSWQAIAEGIGIGLGISLLFALLPLLSIRKTSPLLTLNSFATTTGSNKDPWRWLVLVGILLFVLAFGFLQTDSWAASAAFTIGMAVAFLALLGIAKLIMWLVRRFFPVGLSFLWRQSLANLYRPNNQTPILIVTIGLGTALLTTLFFIQGLLLGQLEVDQDGNRANMIVFDIRSEQKAGVHEIAKSHDFPILQDVPVVGMRLLEINGRAASDIRDDSTSKVPNHVVDREYRVTYRDSLISSETDWEGSWPSDTAGPVVSLERGLAKNMGVVLGDSLVFNVQGIPITVKVAHLREVDWVRVQTNFTVVFPTNVLEDAPKFHVLLTRSENAEASAAFQRDLVQTYPNLSVIGLELILKTLDEVLSQVSFVIQFMALFSIITGLIVLAGSVAVSKYQRIRESVLLRTIGASRKQILAINAIEYFILGSMASLAGMGLAFMGSWLLAVYSFEMEFSPELSPLLVVFFLITGLTMLIGLLNSRSILQKPPLEVLRKEV